LVNSAAKQAKVLFYSLLYVNAGMPEKSNSGIGISSDNQLLQSGIGIPASGFSPVPLVRQCPAMEKSSCQTHLFPI
jgi:hypothetical protein